MAVAALTSEQARMLRDYIPALSAGHPPSFDLAAKLDAIIAEVALITSGSAVVANGDTTVVAALGAAYDGAPIVCTVNGATSNPVGFVNATWDGSGNVTLSVSGDPGLSGANVAYFVDARS